LGERGVTIRGNIRVITQRLALCAAQFGTIRVVARRPDRERDKSATRQLQREIAILASRTFQEMSLRLTFERPRAIVSHAHFGRVEGYEHGRTAAVLRIGGQEQKPVLHYARSDFDLDAILRHVSALLFLLENQLRFRQQLWPGSHLIVPVFEDLRSPRRPFRGGGNRTPIVKFQGRSIVAKLPREFRRRLEVLA
jgi:hypothetical protein